MAHAWFERQGSGGSARMRAVSLGGGRAAPALVTFLKDLPSALRRVI